MKVDFKIIHHGTPQWENAVQLREEILRKPFGSFFTPEELEEEKSHIQIAGSIENDLIATAVLVPEGNKVKMQRVVVSRLLQNGTIGSKMMEFCEKWSLEQGFNEVYCHARDTAVNFYRKNGYSPKGDYFDEDGIPHLKMMKLLGRSIHMTLFSINCIDINSSID